LTIWLTFPASVKKNSLKEFNVYHAEHVLRYHFAEALELNGAIVYARSGEGGDYAGVGEFIHFEEPGGITARDVALDYEIGGPGPQPDIDLEPLYEQARQEATRVTRDIPGQGNASNSGVPTGA